jgi:AcrR family transcriptional regulator
MAETGNASASSRDRVLRDVIDYFAAHGTGEASLRRIASEVGTSHRMLNYYFGSRAGLLTAVVEAVEADQRTLLAAMVAEEAADPTEQLKQFWRQVSDAAMIYGPLFFELSADAMRDLPHASALRTSLIRPWLDLLEERLRQWGVGPEQTAAQARIGLAVARGLLFDLLISGDRRGVDAAMEAFIADVLVAHRH